MRISLFVGLLLAACNSRAPAPLPVTPAAEAPSALPPLSNTAAMEKAVAQGAAAPAPGDAGIHGRIIERIDAPPYSYLKIATAAREVWAAVPQTTLDKGAEVAIDQPMPMHDFTSKTLKRAFPEVFFGTLVGQAGPARAPAAPVAAPATTSTPPEVAIKVEKAKGKDARTVAEIYAQKDTLHDRKVVVRGQVTKYNGGILGKNWLHVRDGSGDKTTGDLTITTQDTAKVGDVVVVTGTVRVGKDFGAGYAYPVMLEEASVATK